MSAHFEFRTHDANRFHAVAKCSNGTHWVEMFADNEHVATFYAPVFTPDPTGWADALAEQLNGGLKPHEIRGAELLRGLDSLTAPKQEAAE